MIKDHDGLEHIASLIHSFFHYLVGGAEDNAKNKCSGKEKGNY